MTFRRPFCLLAITVLSGGLGSSQNQSGGKGQQLELEIDDTGTVVAAHQQMRVKSGHILHWTQKNGPWFVHFSESPCTDGALDFGPPDHTETCTIIVQCAKAGDLGCKTYHYATALGPKQQLHDTSVIVEP